MNTKYEPEYEELEELEEEVEELELETSENGKGQRLSDAATFKILKEKLSGSEERISPIKAIRLKCLDCCCGQRVEVNLCPCEDCPLWPFRFGKNPYSNKTFRWHRAEICSIYPLCCGRDAALCAANC